MFSIVYRDYSNNTVTSTFGSNTYKEMFIASSTIIVYDYDVSGYRVSAKTVFDMSGRSIRPAESLKRLSVTQFPIKITMVDGKFVVNNGVSN